MLGLNISRVPRQDLSLYDGLRGGCFYNVGAGSFSHPYWTNLDHATELPFYVFTLGKLADYLLTIHGLRLGYTELNPLALNPTIIAASLIMYPVFLYVTCLIAGKHPWRSMVLLPGLLPWIVVGWYLAVLTLGAEPAPAHVPPHLALYSAKSIPR